MCKHNNNPGGTIVPMPFPKAILWDMDGVLADTSPLHFKTWERALTEQGIPFDRHKFHLIYGLKNHDLLPYLAGRPLEPQWIERIAAQKELAFRLAIPGHLIPCPGSGTGNPHLYRPVLGEERRPGRPSPRELDEGRTRQRTSHISPEGLPSTGYRYCSDKVSPGSIHILAVPASHAVRVETDPLIPRSGNPVSAGDW